MAQAACLAEARDSMIRRMTGNLSFDEDPDLTDGSSFDNDAPPAVDAYTKRYNCTVNHKGKWTTRRWRFPPPFFVSSFFLCFFNV